MSFWIGDRVVWKGNKQLRGTVSNLNDVYLWVVWDHDPDGQECQNQISYHEKLDPKVDYRDDYEVDA